ncbi:histidinol-phosphate transaminase [Ectothiorhodospira mobilis]|uniref:histidinol-phosphate transaminase n=1 Tax=Ectothiorhodospira mobilis TaxID=195064 RepID=UPI001905DDDC|nr:histidinol-phosphate transaminase [Ectothiorhodospira mobilis]MBK1692695.1 histidinol-phosphate transaminase [Ectothiorhodospira mobilis]
MTWTPETLIRPEIREQSAYPVPPSGGLIKLDAMENPYEWPESLRRPWAEHLAGVAVNRYPDPRAGDLVAALRRVMGIPGGAQVMLGNGSDELIQILLMALAGPGRVVMAPEPAFVMYRTVARWLGMEYVGVPLREDFALDLPALHRALEIHRPAVLFLAYPNNPTGNLWPREAVEQLIESAPGLVVVDEAYSPFAADSFLPAAGSHPRLLVMRTVSKLGLAGLRLGYLCGPAPWLEQLDKLRLPYNVNTLTQAAACFALEHHDVLEAQATAIRRDREALYRGLQALEGIEPFPSEANFILFRTPTGRARSLFEGIRARGVLIKDLSGQGGLLTDCLRVTVGTPGENARFLDALTGALAGGD